MGSVLDYDEGKKRERNELIATRTVTGTLYTTGEISNSARIAAELLQDRVEIIDDVDLPHDYPCIKCNIGADRRKIYHLPMDQLYDRTKIQRQGECYVSTVKEAEDLGFIRAKRWLDSPLT